MRTAPHGTGFGAAWHGFRLFATRPLKKLRRRRAPKPSAWTDLMAVVSCLCLIVLIQAWASANSAHASWHGLLSLVRPLRSKVNTPESKRQAPPFARTGPALPPHTPLTHPPCLYARSLSDLDLGRGRSIGVGSLACFAASCWRACRSSGLAPARHYQTGSAACGAVCARCSPRGSPPGVLLGAMPSVAEQTACAVTRFCCSHHGSQSAPPNRRVCPPSLATSRAVT